MWEFVELVIKAGGEFKRFAIILFKVVLDVISEEGFETKLLKVEFVREEAAAVDDDNDAVVEAEAEEDVDEDEVEEFVLALLIEELCLFNTFCKLFVEKTSCNKEPDADEEELEDEDNCWLREE